MPTRSSSPSLAWIAARFGPQGDADAPACQARERERGAASRPQVAREIRDRQLLEALEKQTATAEILRVISSSPTDLQPIFETILNRSNRLCEASLSVLWLSDGDALTAAAHTNVSPEMAQRLQTARVRPHRGGSPVALTALEQTVIHVPDVLEDPRFSPAEVPAYHLEGARSILAVPMLRGGRLVGVINTWRREVGAFTDEQIELLKTFADQALIAIENVRLFTELQARNYELATALEQQTATGEILRVISSSPTDEKPVFDAIAKSGVRLCEAGFSVVAIFDGDMLHLVADEHVRAEGRQSLAATYPIRPNRGQVAGRAILDRTVIHIPDVTLDPEYVGASGMDNRATLSVPMMRTGTPIGTITIGRFEPLPFTDQQVELLKTFAEQAVIAIENVRLFNETKEALERQTATAEILGVIARSPTGLDPVFEAIVRSAARLCDASDVRLMLVAGDILRHAAGIGPLWREVPADLEIPITRGLVAGRAVVDRRVVHVRDLPAEPEEEFPVGRELARRFGHRTIVAVPLLRDDAPLGVVTVGRGEARPFTEGQVELLRTFADQAVIAIENVRLFTELQTTNRDLAQALDQQTATSEILRTIAHAKTDAQPVFDTIVRSAAQLCKAPNAAVFLTDGKILYHPANYGRAPETLAAARSLYPRPLDMKTTPGMAILTRAVVHVPDIEEPSTSAHVLEIGRVVGFRSVVSVPMLREGEAVGAINVARGEPGRFSDGEVELLKTFADQAVIAVENVRLFKELEARTAALARSVDHLTALGEVGRAVSSTLDLETVLNTIVSRAVQLSGLDGGVVFEYDTDAEEFVQRVATDTGALAEARRTTRIRKGEGVLGRTAITLEPLQVPDIAVPGAYEGRLRETLIQSGVRAILAVPMVREAQLIGCLGVTRKRPGEFPVETIELLRTFATQSALAIQNARLFREIADKSRELEVASQHKSEFLANMSHELRTPLNAILGFSEVLAQGMFGAVNEKQTEYLHDILESGRHLLSLINDILDLSKIEAGRMELELSEFDLPQAIQNALTLVRERALRRGIGLDHAIDDRVAAIRADERKVKQVLLNLLSNAIKFTPEGGRIEVRAAPADGLVEVSVTDTGIGIAPEDLETVFEEFRQVGTADKKAEGTGLGLALARKFIELHGGRIWVKSEPGRGSTFTFTLPVN